MENWKEEEEKMDKTVACSACGNRIAAGSKFCPYCGRNLKSDATAGDMIRHDPMARNGGMTKKEFRKKYASAKAYKDLKSAAITGYVLVVVNVLVAVLMNPAALLDCGILLGLVLGFHLKRSKGCAIGLLCFNIFSILLTLALTGSLTGWMWLIVSVFALKAFNKMDKEYKEQCGDRIDL